MTRQTPDLPEKLQEIADVIGMEPAMKLSAAWPGIRVFVPKAMTPDHQIAVVIGYQAALLLSHHYGGDTITPSKAHNYFRKVMQQRIVEEYRSGASASKLARKYGMRETSVYNLVARVDEEKQASLF